MQVIIVSVLRAIGLILLLLPFISTFYGDYMSTLVGQSKLDNLFALIVMFTPIAIGALLMIYKSPRSVAMPPSIKWLAYAAPASVLYVVANFANNFRF